MTRRLDAPPAAVPLRRAVRTALRGGGLLACALALHAEPAPTPDDNATPDAEIPTIVVTSRYREESAQQVPIPITVLGAAELQRDGTVALQDLVKQAPGLQATTPNSRRTGISLRGIGKSAGNDALEASMGVLVDGVFLTHPGMTYLDFTDLDRIEVLRGPQGTLLGKNTTIGAINYVSKGPSFTPEGSATFAIGERNARAGSGAFSNAILSDVLAYRASVFVDRQDGFINNVNTEGGTTNEKNRSGGRLQLLFTPLEGFSVHLNADYSQTNERSNTKPNIRVLTTFDDAAGSSRVTTPGGTVVPTTSAIRSAQNAGLNTYQSLLARAYFGGYQPIIGSWTTEDLNLNVPVNTSNQGVSTDLEWKPGPVTLTLISATRRFAFDAKNDADQTKFDTGRNGSKVDAGQTSHEFRFTSEPGEHFDYQGGAYFLHSWNTSTGRTLYGVDSGAYSSRNGDYNTLYGSAVGNQLLQASLNQVYVRSTITPETKSYAAFGQSNWHVTDRATLTVGLRETYEQKSSSAVKTATFLDGSPLNSIATLGSSLGASALQVAAAQSIRTGAIGTTYATVAGTPIDAYALSWLLSPTYRVSDDVLLFASTASGQKSGSVQFTSSGAPQNVAPEKVLDIELGVKSLLLARRLQLNLNLFQTRVRGYQQTTSLYDAATTAIRNDGNLYYTSVLGNIPEIRARGVELEGAANIGTGLKLTFGGNYNNAIYTSWHTATCPSELNVKNATAVCDNTGKQIAAAPKVTVSVGADYQHVVFAGFAAHAWLNNLYRSAQNFDNNLSRYGVQDSYTVTDVGIGLLAADEKFEVDLTAKNAFNKHYTTSVNVGSDGTIGYDGIGDPRWVGLVLHARL